MAKRVIVLGFTLAAAAAAASVSAKTAAKWIRRYREQGTSGLADRTCRPHRFYRPSSPEQAEVVEQLRRQRWTGLRISQQTGLSRATVSRILRRRKLSRVRALELRPPVHRYEHQRPGDLLHLDIKKLGRIARPGHRVTGNLADRTRRVGWEYVHVAIDDHSRIAFSAIFADEKACSTVAFLGQALAYYARFGIHFKAVLTDNGPAYRSRAFAAACRAIGIKHRFTRLIRLVQTARLSASSELRCRNGHTRRPIRALNSGATSSLAGCMNTTGTGRIQAWDKKHLSQGLVSIRTIC